jgi:hypothetical protein
MEDRDKTRAKGRKILDTIVRIKEIGKERDRLLRELEWQGRFMEATGLAVQAVQNWGYDPLKDKRPAQERFNVQGYNYVILATGERIDFPFLPTLEQT